MSVQILFRILTGLFAFLLLNCRKCHFSFFREGPAAWWRGGAVHCAGAGRARTGVHAGLHSEPRSRVSPVHAQDTCVGAHVEVRTHGCPNGCAHGEPASGACHACGPDAEFSHPLAGARPAPRTTRGPIWHGDLAISEPLSSLLGGETDTKGPLHGSEGTQPDNFGVWT